MRKWLVIFGTVFVVSALTGWVVADDVDDVYYWPGATTDVQIIIDNESSTSRQQVVSEPSNITFIEDSVTQHSDTIVKAVIHR